MTVIKDSGAVNDEHSGKHAGVEKGPVAGRVLARFVNPDQVVSAP